MIRKLLEWAASKLPTRVIYDRAGAEPYLSRSYVFNTPTHPDGKNPFNPKGHPREGINFRNSRPTGMLHLFHKSDESLDAHGTNWFHNHPFDWGFGIILAGGYMEERISGLNMIGHRAFKPLSLNWITKDTFHRVDLLDGPCWTLFVMGPKTDTWGFKNPETGEFVGWREFLGLTPKDLE